MCSFIVASSVMVVVMPANIVHAAAPVLSSSSPADNATGVNINFDLTLTFDQAIERGTGTVALVRSGTTVESWATATSSALSGFGTSTIVIDRSVALLANTAY
ncbi:MAG: hypothetical protein EBW96_05410, partial [Actinobacteria bacterium]|nr:hypothetical protein [Actinomycetota bacterium]